MLSLRYGTSSLIKAFLAAINKINFSIDKAIETWFCV